MGFTKANPVRVLRVGGEVRPRAEGVNVVLRRKRAVPKVRVGVRVGNRFRVRVRVRIGVRALGLGIGLGLGLGYG